VAQVARYTDFSKQPDSLKNFSPEVVEALKFNDTGGQNEIVGGVITKRDPRFRYTQPPATPTAATPAGPIPALTTPGSTKPTLGTVDEAAIREDNRKRMQASIDAIEANYATLISQEQQLGADRSGQTRSITARSGTLGQDFGQAQQEKTTQFNKQQEKYLVDQKNAQINAVMQNIEDRASAEIARKKDEELGKYQMDMADFEKTQDQARGDLTTLAKSGFNLDTLAPDKKATLFKQAGYDDPAFGELVFNANKPKAEQIDYKFEKLAEGRGMFYGVDPMTGELKRVDISVDLPPDWQVQIAPDGTVIGFDKNTGEARVLSAKGEFGKPEDTEEDQDNELLSVNDAKNLGVPYGTTKGEAKQLGITPAAPMSAEAKKLEGNVDSGLKAVGTMISELFGVDGSTPIDQLQNVRSNIIFRRNLGMANQYDTAVDEVKDVLVRLRTGAAISENEEKFYEGKIPQLLDNEATIKYKLSLFQDLFNNIVPGRLKGMSAPEDLFQEFEGGTPDPKVEAGSTPYLKTLGAITGPDGSPVWKYGLDVDVKKGDPVKSPVSGTVIAAGKNGGFGNQVKIKTDDGSEIWLSHFDSMNVKAGQKIKAGQVIALGGNTGTVIKGKGGDGSHVDITMPNGKGGYFSAREVKAFLDKQFV
jgi:murein DD-endopeptidase MepM/ murein hydrolase activator NlpD